MGPFATAVLAGCLQGLKWLLWLAAALLLLLVVVQALRGDADAVPKSNLALALAFAAGGAACAWIARRVMPR